MAAPPVSLTVRDLMRSFPSPRDINTRIPLADVVEATIAPTITRSITLNCGRYNTSEAVMILYYDVIDPAAGLTPLTGAEPTSPNATAERDGERCRLDCTVKSTIVPQAAANTESSVDRLLQRYEL